MDLTGLPKWYLGCVNKKNMGTSLFQIGFIFQNVIGQLEELNSTRNQDL